MRITSITVQTRNKSRVNVSVDGAYRFSLDISQVADLGIRKNVEYSEAEVDAFEDDSQYGKLYQRALEYCLARPRSEKELDDYLYRKARPRLLKNGNKTSGISDAITSRVRRSIIDKNYVDNQQFARYWVEYRNVKNGASRKKLISELRAKGVDSNCVENALSESERTEVDELQKAIAKKAHRYSEEKLIAYLMRQGFPYSDIKDALKEDS